MPRPERTVRLYPVEGVSLYPYPAVEWDATVEQWAELRTYSPCPFTDQPPAVPAAPAPDAPAETED
jgi:hypothetical protein